MKVETIVGKIRERYACGWKLGDTDAEKLILGFATEYAKSRCFNSQKLKTKKKVHGMTAGQAWEYIQNRLLSERACSALESGGRLALAVIDDIIRDQPDDEGYTLNDFEP